MLISMKLVTDYVEKLFVSISLGLGGISLQIDPLTMLNLGFRLRVWIVFSHVSKIVTHIFYAANLTSFPLWLENISSVLA